MMPSIHAWWLNPRVLCVTPLRGAEVGFGLCLITYLLAFWHGWEVRGQR